MVLWSGDPLELGSPALRVLVGGETVHEWDAEAGPDGRTTAPVLVDGGCRRAWAILGLNQ